MQSNLNCWGFRRHSQCGKSITFGGRPCHDCSLILRHWATIVPPISEGNGHLLARWCWVFDAGHRNAGSFQVCLELVKASPVLNQGCEGTGVVYLRVEQGN